MLTTKRLTVSIAMTLVAIAPGCFPRNQQPVQTSSPPTIESSPSPTPTPTSPSPEKPDPPAAVSAPSSSPTANAPSPSATPPPPAAAAQSADCDNAQTQTEINQCAQVAYDAADKELNRVYQELKNSLNSQEQEELTDAELAWIDYRDQTCESESSQYEGGSIQPTIYYGCLERVTTERTAELQQQLENNS